MPGQSKFLAGPSATKKSYNISMSSLKNRTDNDTMKSLLSSPPRGGKRKPRPQVRDDTSSCYYPSCTGRPSHSSNSESSEDPAGKSLPCETDSDFNDSNDNDDELAQLKKDSSDIGESGTASCTSFEGIERRYENSVNDDIRNIDQTVLQRFHCGAVLDDGVSEIHRPGCRMCRCLEDCPRWNMPDVCPLQWKELFEEKVTDPKDYYEIMKFSKMYHTIYSEGTAIYLYTDEIMAMCKSNKNNLFLDRRFNTGPCYVAMFVFRNQNLYIKNDKKRCPPLMLGPALLHFDSSIDDTFIPFFEHIKSLCDIINAEGEEPNGFDGKALKSSRIPTEQRFLYEAMKRSLGNSVNFCEKNDLPRLLHGKIKKNVTCYSKLKDLIKVLYEQYEEDKKNVMNALNGQGKWRLTTQAQEVLEKDPGSGNTFKDFSAIALQ